MAALRDEILGMVRSTATGRSELCRPGATPEPRREIFMRIDGWLLDILACPECHAPLRADEDASEVVCTSDTCGLAYPVRDDIPVLLVEEARRPK